MIQASALWAALLFGKGEMTEAEKTYRQVLPPMRIEAGRGNIRAESLADALNNFAYLRRTQGDSPEAESLFRETLALFPQMPPEALSQVATTRSTLASTLADQGRFAEALQTSRQAVEEYRRRGETDSPNYGFALNVYGGLLTENGDGAEAETELNRAETIFRKFLSPSTLWLGDNLRNQAILFYGQNKLPEALSKADETLKIYEESFGKHYDHYPTILIVKGLALSKTGKPGEGETILREAVRLRYDTLPPEHFWTALAKSALGENLTIQNRFAEAEPLLLESYESLKSSQGEQNPRTVSAQNRLAALHQIWKKTA